MNEKEKNNNFSCGESHVVSSPVLSRPSLFKTLEVVQAQVEYECFGEIRESRSGKRWLQIDPIYKELCLIVAEMYITPPERLVRVKGVQMEAAIVQEVYEALTHEHIKHVAEKFKEQGHTIYKKTPYLQTALYNVLFEYDASITNECRSNGLI